MWISPLLECLMPFKRGHIERISARSRRLEDFDEFARKALGDRKSKHEEWMAWKSKPTPSAGIRLLSRSRSSPAPNESMMVAAYDRAGQIKASSKFNILL